MQIVPLARFGIGEVPHNLTLQAANGLEVPYLGYAIMDFEVGGIQIPARRVVIIEDACLSSPLLLGMNVITACWNAVFNGSEGSQFLVFLSRVQVQRRHGVRPLQFAKKLLLLEEGMVSWGMYVYPVNRG